MKSERTVLEVFQIAEENGLKLFIKDNKLGIKNKKTTEISPKLLSLIKLHKDDIIDFLEVEVKPMKGNYLSSPMKSFKNRPKDIPLSFGQERLLFIHNLEGSIHYHVPTVLKIKGPLDENVLCKSIKTIVGRHEVLRTVFKDKEGRAYQHVLPVDDFLILQKNKIKKKKLDTHIDQIIRRPFDLSKDYMLRAEIISISEHERILVVVTHHIASDGWSAQIFIKELNLLYSNRLKSGTFDLPPLVMQYADYSIWQKSILEDAKYEKELNYWKNRLEGVSSLELLADFPRPVKKSTNGANYSFDLNKDISQKIYDYSQSKQVSLFVLFLAFYKVFLYKYTGQADICVGTPVANRGRKEIESLIGFFVNTLPLRTIINPEIRFQVFLDEIRRSTLMAFDNQEVPFEKMVEAVLTERDQSLSPLFQTILVLQNSKEVNNLSLGEATAEILPFHDGTTMMDTIFTIEASKDSVEITIEYCTDLFKTGTIKRMAGHFKNLISAIILDPEQNINTYEYITTRERQELLVDFNGLELAYPKEETVIDLFEKQVSQNPDDVAIVFENQQLTYKKLDEESNRLAHYLLDLGIKKEELIPICMDRSLELIIGILGILKAGGTYVPIDMNNPERRIDKILEDTSAKIILSIGSLKQKFLPTKSRTVVFLDQEEFIQHQTSRPKVSLDPKTTVYVIYTSGSTGTPKGVMISHTNLVNLIAFFEFNKHHTSLTSNHTFDNSILEIFSSLSSGSTMFIPLAETVISPKEYANFLYKNKVSHSYIHPMHLEDIASVLQDFDKLYLKQILIGVESIKAQSIEWYVKKAIRIINGYGPTEATIIATSYEVTEMNDIVTPNIPIGRPLPNYRIYILHETSDRLQPIGVIGELYIAGSGLAKGYFNDNGLTKKRFIENPFVHGEKMYRTGDLARWLPDGNIEFLGRSDNQVKIRGHRIELGEIECAVMQLEGVKKAIVLTKEFGQQNAIVAYIIFEKDEVNAKELRDQLGKLLPVYMIPSHYVKLESIPLTQNGKMDRTALPEPQDVDLAFETFTPPATKEEKQLTSIWSDLLGTEKIGIHDNFFALGGDSIMITQLSNILKRKGYNIDVRTLYSTPTILELGKIMVNNSIVKDTSKPSFTKVFDMKNKQSESIAEFVCLTQFQMDEILNKYPLTTAIYPTTSLQKEIFLFHKKNPDYQIDQAIIKSNQRINIDLLKKSWIHAQGKYEILRAKIVYKKGQYDPLIIIEQNPTLEFNLIDWSEKKLKDNEVVLKKINELTYKIRTEDYSSNSDLLFSINIVKINKNEFFEILSLNHVLLEGWSLQILTSTIFENYLKLLNNLPLDSSEEPLRFKKYIEYLNTVDKGDAELFWKSYLKDYLKPASLPSENSLKKGSFRIDDIYKNFNDSLCIEIKELAKKLKITINNVMQLGWAMTLSEIYKVNDIAFGTSMSHRPNTIDNADMAVGMYAFSPPLRIKFTGESYKSILLRMFKDDLNRNRYCFLDLNRYDSEGYPITIFDHLFVFQNIPKAKNDDNTKEFSEYVGQVSGSNYQSITHIYEEENKLKARLFFDKRFFDDDHMTSLFNRYQENLSKIIASASS